MLTLKLFLNGLTHSKEGMEVLLIAGVLSAAAIVFFVTFLVITKGEF